VKPLVDQASCGVNQKSSKSVADIPLRKHELQASEKSKAVLISQSSSFMFKQALPFLRFSSLRSTSSVTFLSTVQQRCFLSTFYKMSNLTIDLTAPNGKKFTLPTGIFINNEFVKSKSGEKITSINPTLATLPPLRILAPRTLLKSTTIPVMNRKYAASSQPVPTTSMSQSKQPGRPSTTLPGEIYRPPTAVLSCSNSPN
jgi:hypothetical protein